MLAMRPFVPLAARRAAAIIAVSQATKADIVRILGVEESKVHVVYEAPSPHFRRVESEEERQRVRHSYGLPRRLMLYVGTLEPRKNLVRLLEAYACLRARYNIDQPLVFVGRRGWKDDAAFAAVERLGLNSAVRFLGYVPARDLVTLYNLAELVAFPSLYEGFGLPVLEAMACGTPVVTSAKGSLCEVAGTAAEFVDPYDVESIAAGLWRVLRDPARQEELCARGLEQAARFSWEQAAHQTRQIYAQAR
jgi:glycosyltransferase involved in cell wall biosynthesis